MKRKVQGWMIVNRALVKNEHIVDVSTSFLISDIAELLQKSYLYGTPKTPKSTITKEPDYKERLQEVKEEFAVFMDEKFMANLHEVIKYVVGDFETLDIDYILLDENNVLLDLVLTLK